MEKIGTGVTRRLGGRATRWLAMAMVLLGASSYGLLSPAVKLAYGHGFDEARVTAAQMMMGTVVMWLLVLVQPKSWANPFRGPWIRLSLIGIFGLALTTLLLNMALARLDASLAIVLLFQFTWITVVMECVHTRRLPTRYQAAAVALILAGTLLAVNVADADWTNIDPLGAAFGLLSACSYSLFLFFVDKVETSWTATFKSAVMLTASLPALCLIDPPQSVFAEHTGALLLWGVALGLLGQVLPTLTFNVGIPRIGSTLAAMLASMELPVAVAGAYFLLGEQVLPVQWAGMGLILIGIVVSELRSSANASA